jgi:uncharacterized protein YbjT (DUF2867 family)
MYAVAGVSGKSGAVVADALLRAGQPVRVVVRAETNGQRWRERGAEVATASLDDAGALTRALQGARGAYLLSPQDPRSPDPISQGWRFADAIARAVEASGLPHLVLLSSMGTQHAEGTGITRTLRAAEERLEPSPAHVTFLRAAFLLENWGPALGPAAEGRLPTFIRPDRKLPMVSTHDVGVVAARALLEGPPATRRDRIELVGPQEYSPREIAAILTRRMGHPVEAELAPLDMVIPVLTHLGASPAFAEQIRQTYQGIEEGKTAPAGEGVRPVRGAVDAEAALAALLAARPAS